MRYGKGCLVSRSDDGQLGAIVRPVDVGTGDVEINEVVIDGRNEKTIITCPGILNTIIHLLLLFRISIKSSFE